MREQKKKIGINKNNCYDCCFPVYSMQIDQPIQENCNWNDRCVCLSVPTEQRKGNFDQQAYLFVNARRQYRQYGSDRPVWSCTQHLNVLYHRYHWYHHNRQVCRITFAFALNCSAHTHTQKANANRANNFIADIKQYPQSSKVASVECVRSWLWLAYKW